MLPRQEGPLEGIQFQSSLLGERAHRFFSDSQGSFLFFKSQRIHFLSPLVPVRKFTFQIPLLKSYLFRFSCKLDLFPSKNGAYSLKSDQLICPSAESLKPSGCRSLNTKPVLNNRSNLVRIVTLSFLPVFLPSFFLFLPFFSQDDQMSF